MSDKRTIQLRAACIVTECGEWNIVGWEPNGDWDGVVGTALDLISPDHHNEQWTLYWLTAEVEVPKAREIEMTVRAADPTE